MARPTKSADTATMIEVRPAVAEDALAAARVHVRSWQSAYRGLIDQDYLDSLTPEGWARRYSFGHMGLAPSTLLAVDGAAICGLVTTGLCRDQDLPNFGELLAIYVEPDQAGAGVGRLLIAAARERLRHRGVISAVLWVLDGNVRAQRFYERDGWKFDGGRRTETFGSAPVKEVRYRRTPV